MHHSELTAMIDLSNQIMSEMDRKDAAEYIEAFDHIHNVFHRLSQVQGLGRLNVHDLLIQQESRSLRASETADDLNHKTSVILGMCYEQLPDQGGEMIYEDLSDHIDREIDYGKMNDVEAADYRHCQEELRTYQGLNPMMLVKRWEARNDLARKIGDTPEVSDSVIGLFDHGVRKNADMIQKASKKAPNIQSEPSLEPDSGP